MHEMPTSAPYCQTVSRTALRQGSTACSACSKKVRPPSSRTSAFDTLGANRSRIHQASRLTGSQSDPSVPGAFFSSVPALHRSRRAERIPRRREPTSCAAERVIDRQVVVRRIFPPGVAALLVSAVGAAVASVLTDRPRQGGCRHRLKTPQFLEQRLGWNSFLVMPPDDRLRHRATTTPRSHCSGRGGLLA